MEYPFKDLLPLDEVLAREGYYKDWTHLDPEVFYSLTQISEYIKTKGYGVDVRLLIAQLAEHFGLKTTQVVDLANLLQNKFDNLEGVTSDFTSDINGLVAQLQADKDAVIANVTVDSEVILSRDGELTLQNRLSRDKLDIIAKMQEMAINVTQAPYSASPTKTAAENTIAIQRALDDYPSVLIPEGEFKHTTLTLRNDNHLMGVGHKSILKNVGSTASIQIGTAEDIMNTRVSYLGITSDKTSPTQHGIEYIGVNPAYSKITGNRLYGLGGHGVYGGHKGHVNNVEITSNTIRSNTGDGINIQYAGGQINGIYIHNNDISWNENGVLFFGNNIVIENNTVQANRRFAFSLSDANLSSVTSGEVSKLCYGSTIRKNYTEQNGYAETENASVIGIFTCYKIDSNLNKVLRNLDISSNYFGEDGAKYKSLIHLVDLKDTDHTSRACVFQTQNNFSHLQLLTYNKTSAIGNGCVIDESVGVMLPDVMINALPTYVEVRGIKRKNALEWRTDIADGVSIGSTRTVTAKHKINEIMLVTIDSFIIFNRTVQNLFPDRGIDGSIVVPGTGTINTNCRITTDNQAVITVKAGSGGGLTRIFYR